MPVSSLFLGGGHQFSQPLYLTRHATVLVVFWPIILIGLSIVFSKGISEINIMSRKVRCSEGVERGWSGGGAKGSSCRQMVLDWRRVLYCRM